MEWADLIQYSLHSRWASLLLCSYLFYAESNVRHLQIMSPCTNSYNVNYLGPEYFRVSPKLYYYLFITCDLISLTLQATGGAMSNNSKGSSQAGVNIAITGLSFQVFTLTVFMALPQTLPFVTCAVVAKLGFCRRHSRFSQHPCPSRYFLFSFDVYIGLMSWAMDILDHWSTMKVYLLNLMEYKFIFFYFWTWLTAQDDHCGRICIKCCASRAPF